MAWLTEYRSGHISENGTVVSAVNRLQIAANSTILKEQTSGAAFNLAAHLTSVSPVASVTTLDIFDAFDELGSNGKCVTDFRMYGQRQTCSGVAAGAVHNEYAIAFGAIVPVTMTVDHQGNAEISYDVYASSSDGDASPIAISTGIAMPAGVVAKRFEMYDLSVAGETLEGKRNFTIAFNPDVSQESADSTKFPTVVSITSIQPTITIRGVDMNWITNLPLDGSRGTRANTVFRLKDRDQGLLNNSHIAIGLDCQVSWNTVKDAGPDAPGEAELQLDAYGPDESTAPLLVSTGVALSV